MSFNRPTMANSTVSPLNRHASTMATAPQQFSPQPQPSQQFARPVQPSFGGGKAGKGSMYGAPPTYGPQPPQFGPQPPMYGPQQTGGSYQSSQPAASFGPHQPQATNFGTFSSQGFGSQGFGAQPTPVPQPTGGYTGYGNSYNQLGGLRALLQGIFGNPRMF